MLKGGGDGGASAASADLGDTAGAMPCKEVERPVIATAEVRRVGDELLAVVPSATIKSATSSSGSTLRMNDMSAAGYSGATLSMPNLGRPEKSLDYS